ncbi:organic cation transporter protein-like protein [Leptotrombidium deliense]|uniref:Organic cation transporter protein-like protein n=1 Tax=Leptotrombidium deliense TaxID=299467 RepID=A0A443S982_9ACAR|nr:organic cation transporter protein-like protein [Leptotrombidium deliense]
MNEKTTVESSEQILHVSDIIGGFGKWQRNIFLFCTSMAMFSSLNNLAYSFYAPGIKYSCIELKNGSTLNISNTKEVCKQQDQCLHWQFDNSVFSSTIIDEWNLICDKSFLASLTQSVYMAGIVVSAVSFGYISDKFGRLTSMWISVAVVIVAGFLSAFSTSIIFFTVARFFVALGSYGRNLTSFLLVMESVGPEYRTITGIAYQFGWTTGYVLLPGIAYLTRNFRHMIIAMTVPEILWLFWLYRIPESIRWQLTNNKLEDAKKSVMNAVRTNNMPMDGAEQKFNALKSTLEKEMIRQTKETSGFTELWKRAEIRKYTIIFYCTWFVNAFVYYGISLNIANFVGDLFVNFAIAGLVEFPAFVSVIIAFKYIGRKKVTAISIFGCGFSLLLAVAFTYTKISSATTVLTMFGKFFASSTFAILYVFSAEVYPTIVRQIGVGSCAVAGRMGSILSPFVKEMSQFTGTWFTLTIFGSLCVLDSFLVLFLPETMNKEIPDTFGDTQKSNEKNNNVV